MCLPIRKIDAAVPKRGESCNYRMIWRRAKYVGIHPPTWEIAAALASYKILRWIAKMRVKELSYHSLSYSVASITHPCRQHGD